MVGNYNLGVQRQAGKLQLGHWFKAGCLENIFQTGFCLPWWSRPVPSGFFCCSTCDCRTAGKTSFSIMWKQASPVSNTHTLSCSWMSTLHTFWGFADASQLFWQLFIFCVFFYVFLLQGAPVAVSFFPMSQISLCVSTQLPHSQSFKTLNCSAFVPALCKTWLVNIYLAERHTVRPRGWLCSTCCDVRGEEIRRWALLQLTLRLIELLSKKNMQCESTQLL